MPRRVLAAMRHVSMPSMKLVTTLFSQLTRAILLTILASVFGFLILFGYFLFGRSWSLPVILTHGHEQVVSARRDWLDQHLKLAELRNRRLDMQRQLAEAEDAIGTAGIAISAVEHSFGQKLEQNDLERSFLEELVTSLSEERDSSLRVHAELEAGPDPDESLDQGLITRPRYVSELTARGDLRLQIANLDASLVQYRVRLAELDRERESLLDAQKALEAEVEGEDAPSRLGFQEFAPLKEWRSAQLDVKVGPSEVERLQSMLQQTEAFEREMETGLRLLEVNPLFQATREPVVVVFVPYENTRAFQPGEPAYRCRVYLVLCSRIGTWGESVDGEMTLPHPLFGRLVRGSFQSIELDVDHDAAQDMLLFGRKPFFL